MQRTPPSGFEASDETTLNVAREPGGATDASAGLLERLRDLKRKDDENDVEVTLPGARIVWVRPVGTLRVGAQGIVDVVCGSSRALLVLNRAGVWKIRSAGPTSTLVLLDGHTFARALGELIL